MPSQDLFGHDNKDIHLCDSMRAASKLIAIVNGITAPAALNRFMWYQHCLSVCTVAHLSGRFDQKVLSAKQWHATVAAKTPCPGEDNKDYKCCLKATAIGGPSSFLLQVLITAEQHNNSTQVYTLLLAVLHLTMAIL